MGRKPSWWQNPQVIVSVGVGLLTISGYIVSTVSADVRQTTRIEQVEETVEKLESSDEQQEAQIEQTERAYDRLQQDVGYIKSGMQDVLTELKRKR